MYIKQVTIKGFKSYRDQTIVEPFSPHLNVIVGRNGSGKSNFFFAIRFVLLDTMSDTRGDDRPKLLHEGGSTASVSAYVEIVFDNSDQRIPIDKDEVVLRRAIGLKKDEYFLDNRHVSRIDVINLLESSGFSRSNPYYIVQQGKITNLATASSADRYNLLKEVAGTKVYDDRRAKSLQILEDTQNKKAQVEEILADIENRLQELEGEKAELDEYRKLDGDRRCIEFALLNKKVQRCNQQLEELDTRHEELSMQIREQSQGEASADNVDEAAQRVERHSRSLQELTSSLTDREAEAQTLLQRKAGLEVAVNASKDEEQLQKQQTKQYKQELKKIRSQIKEKEAELSAISPEFTKAKEELVELKKQLGFLEQEQKLIYDKQARQQQYNTKEERDAAIQQQIEAEQKALSEKEKNLRKQELLLKKFKEAQKQAEKELEASEQQRAKREEQVANFNGVVEQHESRFSNLQETKRELQAKKHDKSKELQQLEDTIKKAQAQIMSTANIHIRQGLESLTNIVKEYNLVGVHGPLYQLIEVQEQFARAADVIAGANMFKVVVDTDEVASKVIDIMNQKKLPGRIGFLPVNRIQPRQRTYPASSDALPLVDYVKADPKFSKIVRHVFGVALVCRELLLSDAIEGVDKFDRVTLDGNKRDRRNVLSGGYEDNRVNRFKMQQHIKQHQAALQERQSELQDLEDKYTQIDHESTKIKSELDTAKKSRDHTMDNLRVVLADIQQKKPRLATQQASVQQLQNKVESLEAEQLPIKHKLELLHQELHLSFDSQVSQQDREKLEELSSDIAELRKKVEQSSTATTELESRKVAIESELNGSLYKLEQRLEDDIAKMSVDANLNSASSKQSELDALVKRQAQIEKEVKTFKTQIDHEDKQLQEAQSKLDEAKEYQSKRDAEEQTVTEKLRNLATRRQTVEHERDKALTAIRELGSLPVDAFEKRESMSETQLQNALKKTKSKLKSFSSVNKKALDQHMQFSEQRDALMGRKNNQDEGDQAITELIHVLDNQKEEAINRTFKQVGKYFKEVFEELVPEGSAGLVMMKPSKGQLDSDERGSAQGEGSEEMQLQGNETDEMLAELDRLRQYKGSSSQYIGVGIKVNFTGRNLDEDANNTIDLSGGQKSLVALALIFAIQRCDPAPFYLFDEIDQALDPVHRTAVASMIHKSSREAQYVATTFRPELLHKADKCYGVTFKDKVSRIGCYDKVDALEFIEDETREQ